MAADRRQAELERTLREGMARYHSVGASAAIVTSDGVAWEMHAGLARRDPPRPCGPDTIYDWGSITKLFCAIAIMQLRDRGRLRIDDSAVRHLPCLARVQNPFGNTEAITLEHLLTHTSGLQGASTPEPLPPGAPWPLWPDVEASMPRIKVEAPPGARYEYSNLGIMLAGRVVELLTRDEWEPHVTKNILMPLGMHEAYFDQTPWHLQGRRAESYHGPEEDGRPYGMDVDHGATTSNGGLKACIRDMARFARWLLDERDASVLSRDSLAEMMRSRREIGEGKRVGFAFHQEARGGAVLVGHGGSAAGFRAGLYVELTRRQALVFACNTDTGKALLEEVKAVFAA